MFMKTGREKFTLFPTRSARVAHSFNIMDKSRFGKVTYNRIVHDALARVWGGQHQQARLQNIVWHAQTLLARVISNSRFLIGQAGATFYFCHFVCWGHAPSPVNASWAMRW